MKTYINDWIFVEWHFDLFLNFLVDLLYCLVYFLHLFLNFVTEPLMRGIELCSFEVSSRQNSHSFVISLLPLLVLKGSVVNGFVNDVEKFEVTFKLFL